MKRHVAVVMLLGLVGVTLWAYQGSPMITTVEPDTGKAGDAVSAKGTNLDKSKVSELYLTDDKNDTKAVVTTQSDSEIKFMIPKMAAGRYHLMVLTANKASMIEQPVILTVE